MRCSTVAMRLAFTPRVVAKRESTTFGGVAGIDVWWGGGVWKTIPESGGAGERMMVVG
jgi:hypothetical protein